MSVSRTSHLNHVFDPMRLRQAVLRMAYAGNSVHIACSFSLIEIVATLCESFVTYPENDPRHPDRDYLVLSKGHGVMALYAAMFARGWLTEHHLDRYYEAGTELFGLAEAHVPGIETSSGSLGQGIGVAAGIALGHKLRNSTAKTYCIVGDGEMNEGSCWEAMQFAAHHKLANLIVIVDANGFQAMGSTHDVSNPRSWIDKFSAFGFETAEVDGHDQEALTQTFRALSSSQSAQPRAVIALTVKGKGVSFMENNNDWHYLRLSSDNYKIAMKELGL